MEQPITHIDDVREKLVDAVLVTCAILMVPFAILSWFRVYTIGVQPIMFVESALAIALATVALLRSGFTLQTKTLVVVGMYFVLAIMGLLVFGLVSRGTDVFILIVVLTTTLLGKRWGWWSVGLTTVAASVVAVGFATGLLVHQVNIADYAQSQLTWGFSIAIVLFLSAIAVTILSGVQDALTDSIRSLQEQAKELAEARDQAEAANRSKSAFMANVSHEFRTPLNAIVGYAELHQNDEGENGRLSEDMGRIAVSGRALTSLVESILELSRFEAGDQRPDPVPLDLNTFLASYMPQYKETASKKGLDLTWQVDAAVPKGVMLDEVRVGKALGHLVDNAIKFTESGTIEVSVSAPHVWDDAIDLVLSVKDTGVGIPEDQLLSVMEPFTQSDGQRIGQYSGTGIGLALSKRIVESLEGLLSVESEVGQGSTFTITFVRLPVEEPLSLD